MLGGEQSSWRLLNNWGEDGGSQAGFARLRTPIPHFFEKLLFIFFFSFQSIAE